MPLRDLDLKSQGQTHRNPVFSTVYYSTRTIRTYQGELTNPPGKVDKDHENPVREG
jgi:hypothetical protein